MQHTLASLSAARCADMELGCIETPSRLLACGREESEHDRLGSAMSWLGAIAELAEEREESDLVACEVIAGKEAASAVVGSDGWVHGAGRWRRGECSYRRRLWVPLFVRWLKWLASGV